MFIVKVCFDILMKGLHSCWFSNELSNVIFSYLLHLYFSCCLLSLLCFYLYKEKMQKTF